MKLKAAQHKLLMARKHQKKLRIEIDMLRKIIIGYGVEPDQRFERLKERNSEIHILYKEKMSFTTIAKKYNLSITRIASICHRMDYKMEKDKLNELGRSS